MRDIYPDTVGYPRDKATALFPPLAYDPEDKLFLLSDRSLGFGFDCRPLTDNDPTLSDRISVLLNLEFPTGTFVQFSLWSSPDIEEHLARVRVSRMVSGREGEQVATKARESFLRQGTREAIDPESGTRVRDVHLFVTVKLPIADTTPTDKEQERYRDLQITMERGLKTAKLYPSVLNADRLVRVMSVLLNWGDTAAWRDLVVPECDTHRVIRDQYLDFDGTIDVDANGIRVKGKHVKLLSVKRYPDSVHFGQGINYLGEVLSGNRGIRGNCLIVSTLYYPDKETIKGGLDRQRQWLIQQSATPIARYLPRLGERKDGFDTLFDAFGNGDSPVQLYTSIVLFADSPTEATAMVADTRTYWRELGFQLLEDKYFCLPLFLNSLPFGSDRDAVRDLNRYRTMATRHVIPLLPLFSDWQGTGTPILQLISRNGQFMPVSLYDSGSNYNCIIAAQSGSGKSFLTNEIITSYLAVGGRCWAIDVGKSYEKLCRQKNGDFLEFSKASDLCLNPFELVADYTEEEDILVGLVQAMAAPTETLSDYQTAGLKRVLKKQWDEQDNALLVDHIATALSAEDDQRLKDLGIQLYAFTSDGQYGRFFNGPNTVSFDNPFSVLELEELKGRKHLQKVILLQLIYQIQQEMYHGQRDRPKVVIIDEAWDLLSEGDTAKFMETGFRRFRKYGGAAVVITQSPGDLYNSPTGIAMAENSANMYLLGQKADTINALEKESRLPLSSGGYSLLKTVHTVPGAYSEIFLITEYGAGIGRLIVDPFHRLLYSTKAEDVTAIETLRARGLTAEQAINQLLVAGEPAAPPMPKRRPQSDQPSAREPQAAEPPHQAHEPARLPSLNDPAKVKEWLDALPLEDLTIAGPRLLRLLMELANTEDLDPYRHDAVTRLFDPPVGEVITRIRRHLANGNGSDVTVARLGSRLAHLLGSSHGRVADALSSSRNPVTRRRGIKARQEQLRCLGLALVCTSMTYAPAEKGVWAAINQALASDKRRLREWPRVRDSVACLLVFALIDTRGLSPTDINRVFDALERLSYQGVRFKKADGCSGFFTGIGDAPPGVGEPPEGTRRVQVDAIIPAIGAANLDKRLRATLVARLRHAVIAKPPRESIADAVPVEAIIGVPGIHAYFQTGDPDDRHPAPGVRPTKVMVVLQDSSDGGCKLYCEDAGHPLAVGEAVSLPAGNSGHRLGAIVWLERTGDQAVYFGIEWLLDVPHPVQVGEHGQTFRAITGVYRARPDRYAMVCEADDSGSIRACIITDGESLRWARVATVRQTNRVKTLLIDWDLDDHADSDQGLTEAWNKLSVPGAQNTVEASA